MPNELTEQAPSLPALMGRQHPLHGLFANVFEKVGGAETLANWATERTEEGYLRNYTDFLKLFAGMVPKASADLTVKEMNIRVDSALIPKPAIDHE